MSATAVDSQPRLAEVFLVMHAERRSGTLKVTDGAGASCYLYFRDGVVQHVRSARARAPIGRALVKRRKLEEGELERALALHRQTGEKLGRCCVKAGLVREEDIREALVFQALEEVTELFTWERPHCAFFRGEPPLDVFDFDDLALPLGLNAEALTREAGRRAAELVVLRRQIPSFADIYTLSPEAFYAMRQKEDGSAEQELLRHLDGERDVAELLEVARLSELEALRALVRLIREGEVVPLSPLQLVHAAADCEREGKLEKAHRLYLRAEAGGLEQLDLPNRIAKLADALGRREEAVARYLEFAERCRQEELPEAAVAAYRKALELDPGSVQAMEQIVGALCDLGKAQEAVGFLKQLARRCDPQTQREKLQRVWQEVLRLQPEDLDAHRELARLFLDAGDRMQGVMEMEELAAIHIAQGQLEEAVGVLREILEIDPECVEAHLQLATTLAQMGRTAEAVQEYARLAEALAGGSDVESANLRFLIEIYEKIVQLDPAHVAARQWLADAYRDKAEVDKALSQYEGLCQALRARGPSPELAEALARLVELRADDYDAREELGRVLAALGRKQEAARVLREACEQAQRAHRFDLARRIGETLLGVEPLDLETHRLLARIAVVDKDDARAFQRSSDAARLAAIARLDDACIECARKALELRADAEMRELLAEALARKEQAQEAAREMVEAGRLHLQAEDFGRAQRAAERAAQLDPGLQAARDLLYMIEARRQAGRGGGGAARAAAERPPDKPMITGGSPEVTIVDRPRRKHGSVAGVANKLKALKGGFGGGLDAAAPAAGGGLAAVSARLKAMKGGLGGAGGGGGQQAEPTSPEAAGWQRLPSDGEAASGSGKLSAADKLRRMKLGGASGPASAPPAAGGEQSASPAPPEGMQPASGGKKALSAAQKLRQLGRGGA